MCLHHSFYLPNQAVKEILDTWENMKFMVVKHYKGTQDRGYILGPVDEIIQCLDDNTFNLQSISGSRFVEPFLQTVHKWEKTLSVIGEVIEVREKTDKSGQEPVSSSKESLKESILCLTLMILFHTFLLDLFWGEGYMIRGVTLSFYFNECIFNFQGS